MTIQTVDCESLGIKDWIAKIDTLSFEAVKMRLRDEEEGAGWNEAYCDRVEIEYRRYLALITYYPTQAIVPSKIVDTFWHFHILDTRAYRDDCMGVFGKFLHHFPYFGMRSKEDLHNLNESYRHTLRVYKEHFGVPPEDIWPSTEAARCPYCTREA